MLMSVLTSIVMSMFIMVGLTAIVGLLYGEGDVTPSSSSPIRLVRTVPVCPWALRGWKQFLQEPGFHTCSANSPHADILTSRRIGLYCRAEPAETRRRLVIVCGTEQVRRSAASKPEKTQDKSSDDFEAG